jgi:acetoin utilization protein AcuB
MKERSMRVSDIMSRDPITIRGEESCHEAAVRMAKYKVRHLPVVDRRGLLEGIVTDRDLRHHLLAKTVTGELGRRPAAPVLEQTRVVDVMSCPAFVTAPDDDLGAAATRMRERHVGALPVVEGRQLIGIVTETDLLRRVLDADAESHIDVADVVVSYP